MAIYSFANRQPQLGDPVWIADNATLIGAVVLGRNSSVWFGAVIRADTDSITLGENCNVQDNAVLHTDAGIQLTLGNNVTVGHQAMLHGCTVGDGSLIGIGATILNRAVIGKQCLVGANALVTENQVFPDRSLILGSPAKAVRELNEEEISNLLNVAEHYVAHWKDYRQGLKELPRMR